MSTNEHLLKYQWPLEYFWFDIWYWYDVVWNDRELYLDCYSQFIVTQKPWRQLCVYAFYAFGYRNIHLTSHLRSDHLIDLLCVRWTKCYNPKARTTHWRENGASVIHSFIHSWYRTQKYLERWIHLWSHKIVIAFYMRFQSKSISFQVHMCVAPLTLSPFRCTLDNVLKNENVKVTPILNWWIKKRQHAIIASPSDKVYFAVVSNSENTEWHTIQQQNKKKQLWIGAGCLWWLLCVSVSVSTVQCRNKQWQKYSKASHQILHALSQFSSQQSKIVACI